MPTQVQPQHYCFGAFRIEPEDRLLLHDGQPVALTRKAYEVLILLVERAGHLVSKEEIMESVWAGTYVSEANLTQTIFMLRKALGESASEPRVIVTVPGHGYRFAAELRQLETQAAAMDTSRPVRAAASRPPRQLWWASAIVALVVAGSVGLWQWRRTATAIPSSPSRMMVAVLPFEDLTGDTGQEYFSDGLTEEMIAQLGRLDPQHLGVIARTSVMQYRQNPQPLPKIAQDLGVQYALEGSVRRGDGKVRITAKLIRLRDQSPLWTRQYDRNLTELLSVQGEIAQEIADGIESTLGEHRIAASHAPPAALSAEQLDAYDLYLKGLYFWNKRTPEALQEAIAAFKQAIAKDPDYARGYAGLANAYAIVLGYGWTPEKDLAEKARVAAVHALQLDPRLAEAHAALAVLAQTYDWDWATAEHEYRVAIELDPNYATAHQWYAEFLSLMGRSSEAQIEIERARQLDPLSLIIGADRGAILFYGRQYDAAIQQFRAVLDMEPKLPRAYMLGWVYIQKLEYSKTLELVNRSRARGGWGYAMDVFALARSGETARAHRELQQMEEFNRRKPVDPLTMAVAYVGVGDNDRAVAWLQKAYDQHSPGLNAIGVDPSFDDVRNDPRFLDILKKVGLNTQ